MQEVESRALVAQQAQPNRQRTIEQPMTRILFAGWLTKEPRTPSFYSRPRQRYFVLTRDSLEWFKPGEDVKHVPHGRLLLEGLRIERAGGAQLVLRPLDGCKLALAGDLLDEWEQAVRATRVLRRRECCAAAVRVALRSLSDGAAAAPGSSALPVCATIRGAPPAISSTRTTSMLKAPSWR